MKRDELLTQMFIAMPTWPGPGADACEISKLTNRLVTGIGWEGNNDGRKPDNCSIAHEGEWFTYTEEEYQARRAELEESAEEDAAWAEKEAQFNGAKPWSGPDDGLPPIHSIVEIAESSEYIKIDAPEGTQVKIYSHFTDDRGVELAAYVCPHGRVGGVAVAQCFRPAKTPEQRARDAIQCSAGDSQMLTEYQARKVYAAIRDGKIPGVQLGG